MFFYLIRDSIGILEKDFEGIFEAPFFGLASTQHSVHPMTIWQKDICKKNGIQQSNLNKSYAQKFVRNCKFGRTIQIQIFVNDHT